MTSHRRLRSLESWVPDDIDRLGAWTNSVNAALGLAVAIVGVVLGGPPLERLDTILVGGGLAVVSAYNLHRIAHHTLEHPDFVRAGGILSLWLVVSAVRIDAATPGVLTDAALCIGVLVFAVSALDFVAQFRGRPGKCRWARTHGPRVSAAAVAAGDTLRRWHRSATSSIRFFLSRDGVRLNTAAILVGIVAGLGAVVFRITIFAAQAVFFGATLNPGAVSFAPIHVPNLFGALAPLGPLRYALVPAVGGLIVGLVIRRTTTAIRGHGVPEVLESLMVHNGQIDPKIAVYKTVSSSIAIASGASLGREGPIVQIGSAAGSYFGAFVHSRYTRTLVAAGAGSGIAATFNTPLAGVMFALEILLSEYALTNVVTVVLSAVTATAVARSVLAFTAVPGVREFLVPITYHIVTPSLEFPLYAGLGVVAAGIGAAVVRLLYASEHLFQDRWDLPGYLTPAIGGALLGVSVLLTAVLLDASPLQSATWLFGVGYGTIHSSIAGDLTLLVLVALAVLKVVGFSLSIGSGNSGGVFSPTLYVGAMAGGAFGVLVNAAFAGTASAGAYALVGTAGVFAATASAPLTATLIIFELTGQYTIILPLLAVTVIGSEVAQGLLDNGTIYTEALRDKGITVQERRIGSLEDLAAKDVMSTDVDTVTVGTSAMDALRVFQQRSHRGLPIVDADDTVAGMLVRSDVEPLVTVTGDTAETVAVCARDGGQSPSTAVEELGTTNVVTATPDTNLLTLVDRMARVDIGRIPIVDTDGSLVGIVTRTDVLAAYDRIPIDDVGDRQWALPDAGA
ncbi:chloride channel protein [Halobacterium salinarum]|uniref:chloride channel protein n=1 Tax=Halobacterium salinarum TaxID=2242 RepID=UPI001F2BAF66|nr:chloride channel protein [Halobacterium salinarum]MCF2207404.1 chloride channel protein [Halobacterium salinarum]